MAMSEYYTQYKFSNADFSDKTPWRIDEDGFLRCTTSVLKSCVMNYSRDELKQVLPEYLRNKAVIRLYVPQDELTKDESLRTLEGKPIRVGHEWQVSGSVESVGNIAGSPTYDEASSLLIADILVSDPAIIKRITEASGDGRLIDQSAAYLSDIDWVPGTAPNGEMYDGVQRNIRYNHVALLPKGQGRAGEDVRILNKDEGCKVSEYTQVKIGNARIRVMNEDVEKLESEVDKKDKELENSVEPAQLEEALAKIAELTATLTATSSERDTLVGQVEQLKQRIEEVTSPEALSGAVADAVEEQAVANEIMNSYPNEKLQEAIQNSRKLFGHELRTHVINHVRIANKKAELSAEEIKNEDRVKGMFQALKDTAKPMKKTVVGESVMKAMNQKAETSGEFLTATDRKNLKFKLFNEARKQKEF